MLDEATVVPETQTHTSPAHRKDPLRCPLDYVVSPSPRAQVEPNQGEKNVHLFFSSVTRIGYYRRGGVGVVALGYGQGLPRRVSVAYHKNKREGKDRDRVGGINQIPVV